MSQFLSKSEIRARFCRAMSDMYKTEVPLYGDLMDLVRDVNAEVMARDPALRARLEAFDNLDRISEERHGAIRLGKAEELFTMRRLFAVMGMEPVGYYDLSVAGIPVHSTAFRPTQGTELKRSPFRVFTSLLRLELIEDAELRQEAEAILARRDIFTPKLRQLIEKSESGGLSGDEAQSFIREALETFRWHSDATVSEATYQKLHDAHRLVADVLSFKGPHINHLTPRTLDIDAVQRLMPERGITPKAVIEGPPPRQCPVLLRQTSFKALEEPIIFAGDQQGHHTARFGEIEQRGVALTRRGRALYDRLLNTSREQGTAADNATHQAQLAEGFRDFPDDHEVLRREGLAFYHYHAVPDALSSYTGDIEEASVEALVEAGALMTTPMIYEDFLPVSAAGIFQSNLGDGGRDEYASQSNQEQFEEALGAKVTDEVDLYAQRQQASQEAALAALR